MKATIYETITNQIIEAIERGTNSYSMPWHRSGANAASPVNAVTSRPYRGVNVLALWIAAEARGYSSGRWATYQQWQDRGCQVRKDEKSTSVAFWKDLKGSDTEDGDDEQRARFVARGYNVFNADQVDGFEALAIPVLPESERIDAAEMFFARVPAKITHGAEVPCFVPSFDEVRMVPFSRFKSASAYYGVLAHELTHWSGAEERLNRDLSVRFGSEAYAMEELIAELGAAFIGGRLALPSEPRTDHAPYIASWLKALTNDSRAIFAAASKAQAAADYLASFESAAS